jgi:hypothetical protein
MYDYESESCPDLIPPNCGLHVSTFLQDSGRHRTTLADQIAQDALCWSGHRPGPCQDGLRLNARDAGANYAALTARDEAFSELCKRSQNAWRWPFADAPALNSMPPENYDQQKPGNGDDNDDNNNGPPDFNDPDAVQRAMDSRERARLERDRIGDQKWRTVGLTDPTAATQIEKQAEAWRHGK